ncbi:prolyl oligopeptidase family serine peptidase [Blastomonas sp.]|uniref:S9 family peptidase n=1 Tax=Blastomonas sp. TaxID=1909299 RepID=UPI002604C0CF|nr:prolyl oligopeptidase family serine peptidase [Blastomonas sp.]MDM7954766.1 prolyl oligopeptidase family serine peptidase [Blastomonas sp.]
MLTTMVSAIAQESAIAEPAVPPPVAMLADGVPPIPLSLVADTRPYLEYRTASFSGWHPQDRSMLITTRFGNVSQLHRVAAPGSARRQISFEEEPIYRGSWSPDGSMLLVEKDAGGNEVSQIYALDVGRMTLLSDGKSRHTLGPWSGDGTLVAFGSNMRTGVYNDIYVMDPRDPASARLVLSSDSGGWVAIDFAPNSQELLVFNYISVTDSQLHIIDVASGEIRKVTRDATPVAYGTLKFAPDGQLWVSSDKDSDVQRIGVLDPTTGLFTPMIDGERWDISNFDIAADGKTIAYVVNEAGFSRLYLYDIDSGAKRPVAGLPPGEIGAGMKFAPWGTLGFTVYSNQSPGDAYSLDPATLRITRWTESETGGLDPADNVLPELIEIQSFDGEPISGLLYRPDAKRHPGKRPLIMSIHGGPEGQATAGFLGRSNYLINELGIALFYPNVRGSTGFGKRFVSLDNGPFLRENSVKDIGALLDRLGKHPMLDPKRFGVTGGSYGGYMCYASAIRYSRRFNAANCIVAISNFVTFLENTEEYRRDLRRFEYGDERVPELRAKLEEISPLTRVDELKMPLLVVTGANDPRVPASEADQIIDAVRSRGGVAWHLLARNEGHGFRRKENADFLFWTTLAFWQRHLLGAKGRSAD